MAMDLNCEFANFNCVMAYQGSKLFEAASKENGFFLPKNWNGFLSIVMKHSHFLQNV